HSILGQATSVLPPLLYSLFTYACRPVYRSKSIIEFADDTMVIRLISDNDETAYRVEVQHLVAWCADNNLLLNTCSLRQRSLSLTSGEKKEECTTPSTTMEWLFHSSYLDICPYLLAAEIKDELTTHKLQSELDKLITLATRINELGGPRNAPGTPVHNRPPSLPFCHHR
ncbi:hypothetical protein QTP70_027712, partial [Hemibagrus guttatus]